ncbi:MAG TPA: hypothetical protein VN837_11425, partial [Chloroflexota bacterium]|nr:hypothetical protein [Chloroflexota bacterium]
EGLPTTSPGDLIAGRSAQERELFLDVHAGESPAMALHWRRIGGRGAPRCPTAKIRAVPLPYQGRGQRASRR